MPGRRAFISAGLAGLAILAGGCAIGGGYEPGPEMDFTIRNQAGSTAVLRFDLGVQSSTEAGLTERVRGAEITVDSGKSLGYSPDERVRRGLERAAAESGGIVIWQAQVRLLGVSWEQPAVEWYEIRGSTPMTITLRAAIDEQTGSRTVHLEASGGEAIRIPREFWPDPVRADASR